MRKFAVVLLWLYVFSLPWDHMLDFGDRIGGISRVLGLLSATAGVIAVIASKSLRRPALPVLLAAGFLFTVVASWFWSIDQSQTARGIRTCAQTMIVMWQVWEFAPTLPKIRALLFAYVLGGYISCSGTIQDFLDTSFFRRSSRFKASGWNENDLAVALALAIPMAAYLGGTSRHHVVRWICWLYLLVSPMAIVLTASRAGVVAGAIALVSGFALLIRSKGRIKMLVPVLGLAIIAVLMAFTPGVAWDRIQTITSSPDLNDRVPLWKSSVDIFDNRPLRPLGAGGFSTALPGPAHVAHNAFLGVLVEEGILGFLCFSALAPTLILSSRHLPALERWLWYSLLVCWVVAAMTLTWEQERVTWFVFGCAAAATACPATNLFVCVPKLSGPHSDAVGGS